MRNSVWFGHLALQSGRRIRTLVEQQPGPGSLRSINLDRQQNTIADIPELRFCQNRKETTDFSPGPFPPAISTTAKERIYSSGLLNAPFLRMWASRLRMAPCRDVSEPKV